MDTYLDSLIPLLEDQLSSLQNNHAAELSSLLAVDRKLKKQPASTNTKLLRAVELLNKLQRHLTPPLFTLPDGLFGFINTKALLCVVKFNIAEILERQGPMNAADLAKASQTSLSAPQLEQILRLLISAGLFSYDPAHGTYSDNAVSALARSGHWTKWFLWAELYPTHFYEMMRHLPEQLIEAEHRTAAQLHFSTHEGLYEALAKSDWVEDFHRTIGSGVTRAQ